MQKPPAYGCSLCQSSIKSKDVTLKTSPDLIAFLCLTQTFCSNVMFLRREPNEKKISHGLLLKLFLGIQSLIIVIFSETLFVLFDVFNSFKYLIITFCNYQLCNIYCLLWDSCNSMMKQWLCSTKHLGTLYIKILKQLFRRLTEIR